MQRRRSMLFPRDSRWSLVTLTNETSLILCPMLRSLHGLESLQTRSFFARLLSDLTAWTMVPLQRERFIDISSQTRHSWTQTARMEFAPSSCFLHAGTETWLPRTLDPMWHIPRKSWLEIARKNSPSASYLCFMKLSGPPTNMQVEMVNLSSQMVTQQVCRIYCLGESVLISNRLQLPRRLCHRLEGRFLAKSCRFYGFPSSLWLI